MSNISKYILFLYPCTSLTVQGLLQRICSLSPWLVSQQVKDKRGYHQCSIAWPEYLLKPVSRITRTVWKKTPSYIHIIRETSTQEGQKSWNSSSFLGAVTFPKKLCEMWSKFPPKGMCSMRGSGKAQRDPKIVAWNHSKSICSIESIASPTDLIDLTGRLGLNLSTLATLFDVVRIVYSIY